MPENQCVHDLVEQQAYATPNAPAVVSLGNEISYWELDACANRAAHLLRSLGVESGTPVALFMERSIASVVAALGILKAGGAYVPLDPNYPPRRISTLLEQSSALLVVTEQGMTDRIPAGPWKTIVLEAQSSDCAQYSRPMKNTTPESLAYIIFTSGSSGSPKGVPVTHSNLMNLISWHQQAFQVTPNDRATLHASPGFDAAVWELWPYLTAGASLHIVDKKIRSTTVDLRDWIVARRITISFLPTALAENMISLPWPNSTQLRTLLTGADTLRRWPPKDLPFTLVNNYGPTECTVVATSGRVEADHVDSKLPSIGKPIDNITVYVVDDKLQLVPPGEAGEILIGGAGVARGYLNAPDLTQEKFIRDPFSDDPSCRLYRTGDFGRYLPNGELAFLGRIDEQIKILGYRVEPREITAVLDRHPGVGQSIVIGRSDLSGVARLVAYVVPQTSAKLTKDELQNFVSDSLPNYMVPTTFVALSELPLSSHGKLDRSALPEPCAGNIIQDDVFLPPQSPIEQQVAGLLSVLIKIERVGRDDNFFKLGGHSLMGAQLVATIRETFGVELSLRSLFEAPTVREMSAEIERLIYERVSAISDEEALRMLASSADRS